MCARMYIYTLYIYICMYIYVCMPGLGRIEVGCTHFYYLKIRTFIYRTKFHKIVKIHKYKIILNINNIKS